MALLTVSVSINGLTISADIIERDKTELECLPQVDQACRALSAAFDLPDVQGVLAKMSDLRGENAVTVDQFTTLVALGGRSGLRFYCKNDRYPKFGCSLTSAQARDYCRAAGINLPATTTEVVHRPVSVELVSIAGKITVNRIVSSVESK